MGAPQEVRQLLDPKNICFHKNRDGGHAKAEVKRGDMAPQNTERVQTPSAAVTVLPVFTPQSASTGTKFKSTHAQAQTVLPR